MDEKMMIAAAVQTDVGCVRILNEDCARVIESGHGIDGRGWLAIVADGMGGHSAGEVASRLAVETIAREFEWRSDDPSAALLDAVRTANRRVFETAAENDGLAGMGTTCTSALLVDWHAHLAHVGDSRLYLIRGGDIFRLTEDDSPVMEMVRQGLITREEARNHGDRNVVLRALGTRPALEPSSWDHPLPLKCGDRLLLSSDGLHDLVDDDEIRQVVTSENHHDACAHLIEMARDRGGPDNITVAVLVIDEDSERRSAVKSTRTLEIPQP